LTVRAAYGIRLGTSHENRTMYASIKFGSAAVPHGIHGWYLEAKLRKRLDCGRSAFFFGHWLLRFFAAPVRSFAHAQLSHPAWLSRYRTA